MNPDQFNLRRFIDAQEPVINGVLDELRAGHKSGHWMWFVFPQIQGLGSSSMAQRYALTGGEEARAYHHHALLGARLRECTRLVLAVEYRAVEQIFGYPDDLKFHSCMTLFAQVAPEEPVYRSALQQYFAGKPDARTLQSGQASAPAR